MKCPACGRSFPAPVKLCRCGYRADGMLLALRAAIPELGNYRGCGCKDAAKLIDKWGAELSLKKMPTLVKMITSANKRIDAALLERKLTEFLQARV